MAEVLSNLSELRILGGEYTVVFDRAFPAICGKKRLPDSSWGKG